MASQRRNPHIAIEDLAADLGITERDLRQMLKSLSPSVTRDHRGREAVPLNSIAALPAEAHSEAIRRALRAESEARRDASREAEAARKARLKLLDQYTPLIEELERLHRRYLNSANRAGPESAGMAAYLLLSRVIATLKMALDCLRNGYWYSGSLLREIDECLDLAHYFGIAKDKPEGIAALRRWFRENVSPSHATCRKAIADWQASLAGFDPGDHLALMQELYRKKSKWTHPTYLAIREVASFDVGEKIQLVSVDYGPCAYEEKIRELTDFFRSSIRSTFQCVGIVFQMTLEMTADDLRLVHSYDKTLQQWTDGA